MKHLLEIDHIGYAVKDIMTTATHYISGGWQLSEIYNEEVQNTQIAFLTKDGFPTIELVSPPINHTPSPIDNILSKSGIAPYHICYVVEDIDKAVDDLFEEGFRPLFLPIESSAMNGKKICYLYSTEVGTIELVSKN